MRGAGLITRGFQMGAMALAKLDMALQLLEEIKTMLEERAGG